MSYLCIVSVYTFKAVATNLSAHRGQAGHTNVWREQEGIERPEANKSILWPKSIQTYLLNTPTNNSGREIQDSWLKGNPILWEEYMQLDDK